MKERKRPITGGGLFRRNAEHMSRSHHGALSRRRAIDMAANRKYRSTHTIVVVVVRCRRRYYYHFYYCCAHRCIRVRGIMYCVQVFFSA